jgi:hypothetical protein
MQFLPLFIYPLVRKVMAGQAGPFDGVLAFLDPLLRRATLVVKPHHPFGGRD